MGQSAYVPLNPDYYHLLDRYEMKSGGMSKSYFTSFKPYRRDQITAFLDSIVSNGIFTSQSDKFNEEYLKIDNWEFTRTELSNSKKPLWKKIISEEIGFCTCGRSGFRCSFESGVLREHRQ